MLKIVGFSGKGVAALHGQSWDGKELLRGEATRLQHQKIDTDKALKTTIKSD